MWQAIWQVKRSAAVRKSSRDRQTSPGNRRMLQTELLLQPRSDLQMLVLVVIMLILSSIAMAYSTFRTRSYLAQLQALETRRDKMQVEWTQLLLEEQAWGSFARIGMVAERQLQMVNPAPTAIVMVRP